MRSMADGCGARWRWIALDTDNGLRARAKAEFGAVEDAVDHVALAGWSVLNAVVHQFGAVGGDDEERRHVGGFDVGRKFNPRAASVVEDTSRRPARGHAAHRAHTIIEVEIGNRRPACAR